jgi:signal peptidase II
MMPLMPTEQTKRTRATPLRLRWRRDLLFFSTAAAALALDQVTKHVVRATLERGDSFPESWPVRFVHVANTGAAFGILQEQNAFLVVTTVIGVAAILLYYWYPPFEHAIMTVAVGMILGGAIGNLSDRLRLGEVTDFIDFPHYPAFNVADSSIVVGVALLVILLLLGWPRAASQRRQQP